MSDSWSDLWLSRVGARLYACEAGRGAPLVLLHGGLATHAACRPLAAALISRHRVITPDLRASGRSHFAGPLDWDLFADDIAALLRSLDLPRAAIGGLSFGAGVATRVALRHPDLVSALIILGPAYGGASLGLSPVQQAAMDTMAAAGARALTDGISALFPLFDALPPPTRTRALALVADYDPASVAALTSFMAAGSHPFASGADLAAITAPAFVVPGTDPEHPPAIADVYLRLPRATRATDASSLAAFLAQLD